MSEIAPIITAVATLIIAIGTVINGRRISQVKQEVKTGNSQSLAQLADATESRRVDKIPIKKRTAVEAAHAMDKDTP